jgi:hypothetical protein
MVDSLYGYRNPLNLDNYFNAIILTDGSEFKFHDIFNKFLCALYGAAGWGSQRAETCT